MPSGWSFNAEAFLDGVQFGVYVGLVSLLLLVAVTGVRRLVSL